MPAAAQPQIDVRRESGVFVVRAEVDLQADQRTAWLTVTDYEQLPRFVPGIRSAKVLARVASGGTERLLVEHAGEFRFLVFTQPVQVWLEVTHEPPQRVLARSVLPSGIGPERSTLREFEGSYELSALDDGRTRFVYRARFEPVQTLLPVLGTILVRHTIAEQFAAMTAEIERRGEANRTQRAER